MDTRKVLEMGGGTVIISLPKAWAKKNGVVRGSTVAVEEISARRLLVRPIASVGAGQGAREVPIEYPRESLRDVMNDITGAYLVGSNAIRVVGRRVISRDDRAALKTAVTRLVGLEVVDEDAKTMAFQFLPDPAALDPEKVVRRMASLISGMLRDSAEGMKRDSSLLGLVAERDDEVDRLYFLLVRSIRTATIDPEVAERYGLAPIECLDYRVLASYLESLGDALTDFSRLANGQPIVREVSGPLVQFLETLEEMGDAAVASFLSRRRVLPRKTASDVAAMREKVAELSREVMSMKGSASGKIVDLLSLLERVASIFVDISDLALPTYQFRNE